MADTETETDLERVRDVLHRAVRRLCPRWLAADREDLVQAACLRVLQLSGKGKEPGTLQASYLWRVAHSAVMDEVRRRRREDRVPEETSDALAGDQGDPEASLRALRVRRAIQEGLQHLSPPRRMAVLLYLHGFSLADSARILGWTAKRVDNQRYLGLAELRRYLEKRGFEA